MNDAKAIRKHAAQHDLFNRLHSIAADERFVSKAALDWFNGRFEVIGRQVICYATDKQPTSAAALGTVIRK